MTKRFIDIWMKEEEALTVVGERDPWVGVVAMDKVGVDTTYRAIPHLAVFTSDMLKMGFEERKIYLENRGKLSGLGTETSLIISGGIGVFVSFDQGYQIKEDVLTLGKLDKAFKSGISNPLTVNYLSAAGESLDVTREETFRKLHGYDKKTLSQMPLSEMQLVGRKEKDGKKAAYPNWEVWVRTSEGVERYFRGADIPFIRGSDGFVSSVMPSIHFPKRFAMVNRGMRAGGTGGANSVTLRDSTPTYSGKQGIVKFYVDGAEEFNDLLVDKVLEATKIATRRGEFVRGVNFCGKTFLEPVGEEKGLPTKVWPKDNLEKKDFWMWIEKDWLSAEDLDDQGYL